MDGVERRPYAFPLLQAIPPRSGKRAEILTTQLLLALGEFRHHVVAFSLRFLVAAGGQLRAGGKEVAGEVAPQFAAALAVFRLLPTAQRLCRTHRKAGIGARPGPRRARP